MTLPRIRLVIRKVGFLWQWEPLDRFSRNADRSQMNHPTLGYWNRMHLYPKKEQAITSAVRAFPEGVIVDEERSAPRTTKPRRRRR